MQQQISYCSSSNSSRGGSSCSSSSIGGDDVLCEEKELQHGNGKGSYADAKQAYTEAMYLQQKQSQERVERASGVR